MDPGGLGALIGISVMIGLILCQRMKDVLSKRNKKGEISLQTPILVRKHSKINMVLPK